MAGEQPGTFNARSDHAALETFADELGDRLTRRPRANKAYKMDVSLCERECRQLGLTGWNPIASEALANLRQQWGKQLEWIAAEHMAKGRPHLHLAIKAVYRDESGRHRQLRLDKQHLEEIKREVSRMIERHRVRERERSRPLEIADTLLYAFDRALRETWPRSWRQSTRLSRPTSVGCGSGQRVSDDRGR